MTMNDRDFFDCCLLVSVWLAGRRRQVSFFLLALVESGDPPNYRSRRLSGFQFLTRLKMEDLTNSFR